MGDYSLGHFNFTLKKLNTDVGKKIEAMAREPYSEIMVGEHRIYFGSSAYHSEESFFVCESAPDYDYNYGRPGSEPVGKRYVMTFQIKYGCRQLRAFAEWLAPHVIVNEQNMGFIGYSISEYADVPTAFIVGENGALLDHLPEMILEEENHK